MNGKVMMFVDQYGMKVWASTVKELRAKVDGGGSRVSKMYRDGPKGEAIHVGYVVGTHWFNAFIPMAISA